MEESNLDDFFAKKDKSKKKSKPKIKTDDIVSPPLPVQENEDNLTKLKKKSKFKIKTDDIVPQPVPAQENEVREDDAPKPVKKKKPKPSKKAEADTSDTKKKIEEDDEWKDYEEEEKVDYTGLRIREMQLAKAEEEREEEERNEEEEAEGKENREGGPWNKDSAEYVPAPVKQSKPEPTPETKTEPVKSGKYVPPSRRGVGGEAMVDGGPQVRRKKKEAPNLHSEHDFPTLGGADYTQGGEFEEVIVKGGHGGRHKKEDPSQQRVNLQLDNKFGALENDDTEPEPETKSEPVKSGKYVPPSRRGLVNS